MKLRTRQTGKLQWSKSEQTGFWSCTFSTPDGIRTVSTMTADKREAVIMARESKLHWLNTNRFQRKVNAALSGCRHIRIEASIAEWAESKRRSGTMQERTIESYRLTMHAFARDSGLLKEQPCAICEEHVNKWINGAGAGRASTRRFKLMVLKRWFDWLIAQHYTLTNHPRSLEKINMSALSHEQKEPRRKVAFTEDEIGRLLAYIDGKVISEKVDRDRLDPVTRNAYRGYDIQKRIETLEFWRAAIVIGRFVGLRIGDVAGLERASFTESSVVVHTDKTDARIDVPLNSALREVFYAHAADDRQFLFPAQQKINANKQRAQLPAQFATLLKRCGITNRSFHSLRVSFATDAVERFMAAGKTREEAVRLVADLVGHSSTHVTEKHYLPT